LRTPFGESLVQTQFVADQDHRAGRGGAHIVQHLADEFVELRLIRRHDFAP
jgi:hypothetical protein